MTLADVPQLFFLAITAVLYLLYAYFKHAEDESAARVLQLSFLLTFTVFLITLFF